MALRYQLADLKRSTIRNISGACQDSQQFLDIVNEVQRRLMRRGGWYDTEWLVRLCLYNGCVTWPRYVGTLLGARMCDGRAGEIKNNWYSIIGGARSMQQTGGSWGLWGLDPGGGDLVFEDAGTAPCYNQISGSTGKLIRYYVKYQNDIGKKITLYGKAYGGQPLQHKDANGDWVDGLILTAAAPFVTSAVSVTQIDAVIREATQGFAYLYEYDVDTDKLRDLAVYEPNETNPRYRRSAIRNYCDATGCNQTTTVSGTDYTQKRVQVEALVKLENFGLVNDNDFLPIDNFEAYKHGYQAVKLQEANDLKTAEAHWLLAVRELNFELRTQNPESQTPVAVNIVNGCSISNPI